MPIENHPLVLEERTSFPGLRGAMRCDDELQFTDDEGLILKLVNSWYCFARGCEVLVFENPLNGHSIHCTISVAQPGQKMAYWLSVLEATTGVWSLEAELAALTRLQSLVTEHAYKCYMIGGCFLETSKRSGVCYVFRKGRPTIAMVADHGQMRILSVLCLHPIGYYQGTWAGVMVPTDDVIAHLVMMRGDEHLFWRKAHQHHSWDIMAGI